MQSLLQTAEENAPASLGILNRHIGSMFGNPKSLFIRTTPKMMLFEGIRFCIDTRGIADVMCQIVRDRQLNTMQEMPDKSLRFSMFRFVRYYHHTIII